ncbi:10050_t:CDS:10, partial [Entrophospora sp. SA101]
MNFFKSKSPPEPKPDTLIPEYNANFLSKLTFWWSGDLIKLGYQRPLEKEDLYTLNDERLTKNVCDRFEKEWQKELEKTGSDKRPSLIRALNRTFFWKFWIAGLCRFVGDMLQVTSPLIIQEIISYASKSYYNAQGQDSAAYGYGLIIILFVMQFGSTFLLNMFFFGAMETGFFVRTSLIASIYRKAIVLSGKARSDFTAGKITNLMSTDTFRIDFVCGYFHVAWTSPIMLAIALGLLIKNLGPSALAGFGLLIVMGPLQGYIMKSLTTLRAKAAKVTDERVKLTQEVLQGIRVIKYYAWEDSFLDALNKLRIKEMRYIRLLLTVRAGIMSVSLVIPVFASMLAFITYSLAGGVLNAPIIFSSLALFNVIRMPLMFIPIIMASIADALVALSRIQSLLLADELDSLPKIVESDDFAVRVTDGEFLWDTAPPPEDLATKKSAKRKRRFSRKVKSNNNGGDSNGNGNSDNGKKNDATLVVLNDDGTSNNIDQTLKPLIPKSHLRNINLNIAKGKLVGVVGSVGSVLNAPIIFSSLALFNVIRMPLMFIPIIMASIADALVALSRIQSLLLADELDSLPKIVESDDFAVRVTDGEFLWDTAPPPEDLATKKSAKRKRRFSRKVKSNNNGGDSNGNGNSDNGKKNDATLVVLNDDGTSNNIDQTLKPLIPKSHLRNINLNIAKGKLVGVVGSVGSGKSSLLSALVGEMKRVKGETEFSGSVGYCPQTAWIQNATLRDNITFGLPFNEEKYRRVIKDCCLEPDIEILPAGDLTEIGEKGINLSGGQKQRINIARAVYFDADIILLDDPLSAVDAHVGKSLFANCIQGALANKTRILVTHHLHILANVDYVIVMKDGEIVEQGTYDELMKASKNFAQLIEEYGEADEEEKASGGIILVPFIILLLILQQGTNIGNNLWLSFWTSQTFDISTSVYMGVYFAWGISTGFFGLAMGVSFAISGVVAAKRLHNSALKRILRAPTKFFDTTPLGRIINSKDMDTVDSILSDAYRMMLSTFSVVIGTFILISIVFVWFLVPLVPLVILYYLFALYYRATNRELKRLDSILRSSLYAHFSETLTGLPTIRAYRVQERFIRTNEKYTDIENRAYFLTITVQRWLGLRLEGIANVLIFFASLFAIILRHSTDPAITGLVLSYALQISGTLNWCVRQASEVEANMNAVERLVYYSNDLEVEAEPIIPDHRPPSEWPDKGQIEVKDLVVQYGPDNPPVLKSISFKVKPTERVGIVGRTGCGKSTLATSFFRLIEPTSGKIELDGIDISTIGLKDLRSKITIIPQDPVIFTGTLRSNLDPFNEHEDLTLWNALKRAHLIQEDLSSPNLENEKPSGAVIDDEPDSMTKSEAVTTTMVSEKVVVQEGGSNFSQGQQQLIALARALVRQSKVIIMDEATASVDFRTDHLIQTTIREEFKDSTILTIAHRLRTVIDFDKILVMDAGNIMEFDSPYLLLQNPNSTFRSMCENSGEFNELYE